MLQPCSRCKKFYARMIDYPHEHCMACTYEKAADRELLRALVDKDDGAPMLLVLECVKRLMRRASQEDELV